MGSKDPSDKDSYEVEVNLTASQEIPRKRRRMRKQTDLLSPDEIAVIKRADSLTLEEMPSFDSSLDYDLDSPRPTHELEEAPAPPETEVKEPERAMAPTEREIPRLSAGKKPEDPRTRQPTVTMTAPRSKKSTLLPVLIALVCMVGLVGGVGVGLFIFVADEAPPKTEPQEGVGGQEGDQSDPIPSVSVVPSEEADAGTVEPPAPKPPRARPPSPTEDDERGAGDKSRYRMVD